MTEANIQGTPVVTSPEVCTACVLAKMLETGVMSGAVDAGHSQCEGTRQEPCRCGCEYSLQHQCKECGRKGTNLDDGGQCVDRRDCANVILAAAAAKRAADHQRKLEAPPKRTGGRVSGTPRDCMCGCGEKTGGGNYRPGHDARHVSQLVASIKAGSEKLEDVIDELPSQALRDKLTKAVNG